MSPARTALWPFSVSVYARPGVKPACLALQDAGLDVNVALWIVWTCLSQRDPGPALGQACDLSALWSARVVRPLRAARDALKAPPEFADPQAAADLRKDVLAAELGAERIQQQALERLSGACPPSQDGARALALARLKDYAARLTGPAPVDAFVESVFGAAENV